MVQAVQSSKVDFQELIQRFNLRVTRDPQFFSEWRESLPELSEGDRTFLDKVQAGYWNLVEHPPLSEKAIQVFVLGPLLFLADFCLPPFHIQTEKSVEITEEADGLIIRGRIDILLLKEQFWALVIESKEAEFSIEAGLAQLLAYMLANPATEKPGYGLIASGGGFTFVKLVRGAVNQYALSRIFEIRNPGNDLYDVLKILKYIAQL
jgi:hypothetical protein